MGSSPLTRGKRRLLIGGRSDLGLIPAHAGKTPPWIRRARASRAHPRSRGENRKSCVAGLEDAGSSPLTRGKLGRQGADFRPPRLIPAHAGKTPDRNRPARHNRAHPRSRGENIEDVRAIPVALGSSPLTRGKRINAARAAGRLGLIPAHAGKTPGRRILSGMRRAHPRSRGENGPLSWRGRR